MLTVHLNGKRVILRIGLKGGCRARCSADADIAIVKAPSSQRGLHQPAYGRDQEHSTANGWVCGRIIGPIVGHLEWRTPSYGHSFPSQGADLRV